MYRRSALISNIITRARERVRGLNGLNGTSDKIRADVEWLLAESRFMYGDIVIEVWTTFHSDQPTNPLSRSILMIVKNHLAHL